MDVWHDSFTYYNAENFHAILVFQSCLEIVTIGADAYTHVKQ